MRCVADVRGRGVSWFTHAITAFGLPISAHFVSEYNFPRNLLLKAAM
jgi:hypothetical protein